MTLKLYNVTRKLEACQGPNLFPNITNRNTQYVYYPAFKFKCKFSEHFYEQFFLKKSVRPTTPLTIFNFQFLFVIFFFWLREIGEKSAHKLLMKLTRCVSNTWSAEREEKFKEHFLRRLERINYIIWAFINSSSKFFFEFFMTFQKICRICILQ